MRVRFLTSLGAVACAVWGAACAPARVTSVRDPAAARRFEILDVADTTFRVVTTGTPWVRTGDVGVAVDPARRDALVARFVVRQRVGDTTTVAITGQTSRVALSHVALLNPPRNRVSRGGAFWLGAVVGGVVGGAAALATR